MLCPCIEKEEQKFSFTYNGALIVDNGNWTLGEYLKKFHKSDVTLESSDDLPSTSVCMQVQALNQN